jgi:hypothetical protein
MKQTVVMPCHKRIEMLALSLESLERTNEELDVRIFLDTATPERLDEVEYVRDTFYPEALIFHARPHIQAPSGMYNILNALKQGLKWGGELIYIVEEDVVVRPDFFQWHQQAQKQGNFLATCGRRIPNLPNYNQYTNPGSCFSKDKLELVCSYITDDLFKAPREHMDRVFGKHDEVSDLDDGLVRRIGITHNLSVLYPDVPKCSHIGFVAYNRYFGWVNEGDIKTRIENLRKMLPTVDRKNKYTSDFEPI